MNPSAKLEMELVLVKWAPVCDTEDRDVDVWCDLLCLCVRFPNPAQICYMNSSLQSLLTLTEFIRDVNSQEEAWSLIPEAELIRYSSHTHTHTHTHTHVVLKFLLKPEDRNEIITTIFLHPLQPLCEHCKMSRLWRWPPKTPGPRYVQEGPLSPGSWIWGQQPESESAGF